MTSTGGEETGVMRNETNESWIGKQKTGKVNKQPFSENTIIQKSKCRNARFFNSLILNLCLPQLK